MLISDLQKKKKKSFPEAALLLDFKSYLVVKALSNDCGEHKDRLPYLKQRKGMSSDFNHSIFPSYSPKNKTRPLASS